MTTTVITTKGQVVIPSAVRKHLHIRSGMRFCVIEEEDKIILQPLTYNYFERMAGVLKTKGRLGRLLKEERTKDKEHEDRR